MRCVARALGRWRRPTWIALISGSVACACGARTSLEPAVRIEGDPSRDDLCGDHLVGPTEACDDGNDSSADACLTDCVLARCGDGIVREGFEACDDGNAIEEDACRNICSLPTCGDGIVDAGEDCDDANGDDGDACPGLCVAAKCGDGFVWEGFEECDGGAANADGPAFVLTQGSLQRTVRPVERGLEPESFYDYRSASAHTGFESDRASRLFLYRETGTAELTLFTIHGIDDDAGGSQPKSDVVQRFLHLPLSVEVGLSDDKPSEFFLAEPGRAVGDFHFNGNSDGGILIGLPMPGAWSIDIESDFELGITDWGYVDQAGELITLEPAGAANLSSFEHASPCRLDCTLPRCGDGILDGGELCDDGNTAGGDGCAADCNGG